VLAWRLDKQPTPRPKAATYLIRILEAQDELTPGGLGEQVIVQGRPQGSKVKVTCWRRRKTSPGGLFWQFEPGGSEFLRSDFGLQSLGQGALFGLLTSARGGVKTSCPGPEGEIWPRTRADAPSACRPCYKKKAMHGLRLAMTLRGFRKSCMRMLMLFRDGRIVRFTVTGGAASVKLRVHICSGQS